MDRAVYRLTKMRENLRERLAWDLEVLASCFERGRRQASYHDRHL